jgi:hypothetical protein
MGVNKSDRAKMQFYEFQNIEIVIFWSSVQNPVVCLIYLDISSKQIGRICA